MAWSKLFSVGPHFPFLTLLIVVALILGISKYKKANLTFLASACLWLISSAETIGFVIFFDEGNYGRMILGVIPFSLSIGLLLSTQTKLKLINTNAKKVFLASLFVLIGIGSYAYKPTTKEVNCWYFLDSGKTYNVLLAEAPERTFEVELSSDELKNEVKADALQYEGRDGYYCPETKVRVVTRFGTIISAQIMSFRNSEIDKKVTFSSPTKIPLNKVNGKLEILKPFLLSVWN
ncbi:hypothetical protein GCM10011506_04780 [Marivirga lumbricoides]|uniref:Uncharacterized protein n=2 Tax=Marivirga lumbricoides TaxID=1046115 RepID=A0ABQ1LBS7_9BACT|nr:hypothetical protein GCM10011506_04780 [Marivirga lumbricoides]